MQVNGGVVKEMSQCDGSQVMVLMVLMVLMLLMVLMVLMVIAVL